MASWIREHFRTFVWPALDAVSSGAGQAFLSSKPRPPAWLPELTNKLKEEVNPPSDLPHPELNLLRGYYQHYLKTDPHKNASYHAMWEYDQWGGTVEHDAPWSSEETWGRVRRSFDSAASYAQQKGRPLLLAGRDVWIFKILAERRGVPAIYIPEISRAVARSKPALLHLVEKHGVTGGELLLDTGFVGSIPRAMSRAMDKEIEFLLLSQDPKGRIPRRVSKETALAVPQQVFPNMKGSRSFALWMEYLPKYFETGRVAWQDVLKDAEEGAWEGTHATQPLATAKEIVAAACLTSCVWHGIPDWATMLSKITGAPPPPKKPPSSAKPTVTKPKPGVWSFEEDDY